MQRPTGAPPQPKKVGIKEMLEHFLDFRIIVTERRFQYQLAELQARIHILDGFVTIFDALDETIKIIRASDGKEDAAQKIIKRFKLDEIQVDAILELKLYKLAKLEINVIPRELDEKFHRGQADPEDPEERGEARGRWSAASSRRSRSSTAPAQDQDRWGGRGASIRRRRVHRRGGRPRGRHPRRLDQARARAQGSEPDPHPRRRHRHPRAPGLDAREVIFFTNKGTAYVIKINDINATTGHGDRRRSTSSSTTASGSSPR